MKQIQLSTAAMYQVELALRTRIDEASANERDYKQKAWGVELAKAWAKRKEEAIATLTEFRAQAEKAIAFKSLNSDTSSNRKNRAHAAYRKFRSLAA